jgi:Fe-S-cluster-containing dehydrogenase component/formate-dependent nitrite reductase membrane component NrfD
VPVGVNRTWVKQVEKGEFPNSRRLFSVMRCNHCTDAPCVEICPVEALFIRDDGIVDFDKNRCIGCKSCMQACPYDALYIDPETHTAAKCNYCAHRIDIGLEPACVNVCPEHAIISGDMENPESEIAQLLSRQSAKARKPEKGTIPNLFYIDGDDNSLIPSMAEKTSGTMWSSQSHGVGHFAKEAEKLAFSNNDILTELVNLNGGYEQNGHKTTSPKTIEVVMDKAKSVYDTPSKGILWGWEVSAYVWTKAISAGAFLFPFIGWLLGYGDFNNTTSYTSVIVGLIFLMLTGILLIKDLDQPKRFAYVLLRPQWKSWLVKGGYSITVYGGLLSVLALLTYMNWESMVPLFRWLTFVIGMIVAVYTAFLFAQSKGRDFWQSPTLSIHMVIHSIMAGAAIYGIINMIFPIESGILPFVSIALIAGIIINVFTIASELMTTHPTLDAATTVTMITKGRYKNLFWFGVIFVGNILPFVLLLTVELSPVIMGAIGIMVLIGIYCTEHIWVEAPQRIPLS